MNNLNYNDLVKQKLKLLNVGLLLLFVFVNLTVLFPPSVSAATTKYTPRDTARAYQATLALSNCISDAELDDKRSQSALDNGEIFYEQRLRDVTKRPGYLVDPKEDGSVRCERGADVLLLFQAIDESPAKLLVELGIYKPQNNASDQFDLIKKNDEAITLIKNKVKAKFGITLTGISSAEKYITAKAAFDQKCKKDVVTSGGTGVWIIDDQGGGGEAGQQKNYTLNFDLNSDRKIEIGYGLGFANNEATCKEIISVMNNNYKQYADKIRELVGAGVDTTNSGSVGGSGETATSDDSNSCEAQGKLSWVYCPVIEILGGALNWLDTQIARLLEIDRNLYANESMYAAWSQFRNIALTLLIGAMLIMVISTAVGVGFLDAYTVKKSFPRMVISIVFILLSWNICTLLIDFFNILGRGTLGLMTSPFGIQNNTLQDMFDQSAGNTAIQIGGLALGAGVLSTVTGALGIVASWFAAGMLILGIAFLVLIARQLFIIVLILFAPLAILSWIFPNNNKLWKFWWDSFSKLLFMFPLIMALIGAGRIFAFVVGSGNSGGAQGGLLEPLLKLTAYIIPYAFIPFTFKAAGGVFGNLAGMANDRGRGAFDRLRKGRQKNMSEIAQRNKVGELTRGTNRFSNRLNKIGAGAAQNPLTGAGFSSRNKANIEKLKSARKEQLLKEPGVNQMLMDDDVRGVLLAGSDRADSFLAAKGIAKGSDKYREVMGSARSIGFSDSSRLAAIEGESTHGKGRNMEAMSTIYGAGGDQSAAMMSLINDIGTSGGMANTGTERLRQNTMYQFGANGRGDLRQETVDKVMDGKFDTGLIRGMTDAGMQSLAGAEVSRLTGGSPPQKEQAAAQLLALHESRTGLSEPAIQELDKALVTAGIDLSSSESIDMQLAKQLVAPTDRVAYDSARASQKLAQDTIITTQAGGGAVTPVMQAALTQANATLALTQRPITDVAQQTRAKSATYSSSLPYQAREQP